MSRLVRLLSVGVLVAACGGEEVVWEWDLPDGFPEPKVPEDNPMSAAKVELGRRLFYDARLSGNGTQACASCHDPALAFTVAESTVEGSTGDAGVRNPMALVNVAYNTAHTWANPVLLELEQQAQVPLFGEFPTELSAMNHEDEILDACAVALNGEKRFPREDPA